MVHRFGQSSRDYSAPPPNRSDDLSWSSGWVYHGECTSVCDALDMAYNESWHKAINCPNSPIYYTAWSLNFKRILSLCQNQQETFTYGWDRKVIIYPYRLGHYWWRLVATSILKIGTMIAHRIKTVCHLGWSKGNVIMKSMVILIPLVEFDICSLEVEYVSWSHNK